MTGRRRAVERQRAVFDEHRRFAEQVVAEAKIRFRLEELIGMTVADARAVVETAGGEFATDNGPIRAKWDPNRVIASVDGDRVIRVNVG